MIVVTKCIEYRNIISNSFYWISTCLSLFRPSEKGEFKTTLINVVMMMMIAWRLLVSAKINLRHRDTQLDSDTTKTHDSKHTKFS